MSESKVLLPLNPLDPEQAKLHHLPGYTDIGADGKSYDDSNKKALATFIEYIGDNLINAEAFKNFSTQLENLSNTERATTIAAALKKIALIYQQHEKEISSLIEQIEKNPSAAKKASNLDNKYINLLNAYCVLKELEKLYLARNLPYEHQTSYSNLEHELPFAINALTLTGKLLVTGQYGEIKFGEALYPSLFTEGNYPPPKLAL